MRLARIHRHLKRQPLTLQRPPKSIRLLNRHPLVSLSVQNQHRRDHASDLHRVRKLPDRTPGASGEVLLLQLPRRRPRQLALHAADVRGEAHGIRVRDAGARDGGAEFPVPALQAVPHGAHVAQEAALAPARDDQMVFVREALVDGDLGGGDDVGVVVDAAAAAAVGGEAVASPGGAAVVGDEETVAVREEERRPHEMHIECVCETVVGPSVRNNDGGLRLAWGFLLLGVVADGGNEHGVQVLLIVIRPAAEEAGLAEFLLCHAFAVRRELDESSSRCRRGVDLVRFVRVSNGDRHDHLVAVRRESCVPAHDPLFLAKQRLSIQHPNLILHRMLNQHRQITSDFLHAGRAVLFSMRDLLKRRWRLIKIERIDGIGALSAVEIRRPCEVQLVPGEGETTQVRWCPSS